MLKIDNIVAHDCDKNKRIKKIEEKLKDIPSKLSEYDSMKSQIMEKSADIFNIIKLGELAANVGLLTSSESLCFCFDGVFSIKLGQLRFSKIYNPEHNCREVTLIYDNTLGIKFVDSYDGVIHKTFQFLLMKDFLSQFDTFYETYLSYLEKETDIKDS